MNDTIKRSVLYYNLAREIWANLERRFTVSNGALKYKLNKELYDIKQEGQPINEYYTRLSVLWEDIENLNDFPAITQMNDEIRAFLNAVRKQKEEQQLFQFLNGLDDDYSQQRSQLLLQTPLPTVKTALAQLQ
ncbi:Apolipoprotein A-I [Bienertia sinuspersici]